MSLISVVDYGMGNLSSVAKALERFAPPAKVVVTSSSDKILSSDAVVLPGVGAFDTAINNLKRAGLWNLLSRIIIEKPFLGICLGFQLLFERSEEGKLKGLGLIKENIKLFKSRTVKNLRVPHIGWNKVEYKKNMSPDIMTGVPSGSYFYFVHSYYAPLFSLHAKENIFSCYTSYEDIKFCSAISFNSGKAFACQFHPEKSGAVGLKIIKNFVSGIK